MYERTLAQSRRRHGWPSGSRPADHPLTCVMCGERYQGTQDIALCPLHQGPICPQCCHQACHLTAGP
jgi:hypothetical protein